MAVFVHHCPSTQRRFLYTIPVHLTAAFVLHPHLPNGGFHTPSPPISQYTISRPPLWFSYTISAAYTLLPAQSLCSRTITHPPNFGFIAPSVARPIMVFLHHRPPAQLWFYRTVSSLPNHGVLAPAPIRSSAVLLHRHCSSSHGVLAPSAARLLWFSRAVCRPPGHGVLTLSPTHLVVVLLHCRPPAQSWCPRTIAHPPCCGFLSPSVAHLIVVFQHRRFPPKIGRAHV